MESLVLKKRKNAYGEYKIRYYKDGKQIEEGAYYTDDWDDAIRTFIHIAVDLNKNYKHVSGKTESLFTIN